MSAADVDSLLRRPAVVFGSLPPGGRDLDLLVSSGEAEEIESALRAAGWVAAGATFARFADCTAYAVDVVDVSRWAPTERAAQALFEQSTPLQGYECLRAPAPHHRLLILAHRVSRGDRLAAKHVAALRAFDASVWEDATTEAGQWGHEVALERLRDMAGADSTPDGPDDRARRHGRRVVSLSGLDGCGKSTQAMHLCDALGRLGIDARVQWTKIGRDAVLARIAAPVKAVLGRLPEARLPVQDGDVEVGAEERNYPDGPPREPDAASRWRRRVPVLTWGWTFAVVLANAANHRRSVLEDERSVVVCDRYVLDSQAHLRHRYPSASRFGLQSRLVRLLSPRPACEILLDVPPAVARARKPEQYTTADLVRLREDYLTAAAGSRVVVIDADRPVADVAADVGETVWSALTVRHRHRLRGGTLTLRRRHRAWRPGSSR